LCEILRHAERKGPRESALNPEGEHFVRRSLSLFLKQLGAKAKKATFNSTRVSARAFADEEVSEYLVKHCGDYPLRSHVEAFCNRPVPVATSFRPTGLDKFEYLRLADGIVRYFAAFQNKRGTIIDPYEEKEKQYSTPAFSCAAAILYASGYNRHVLPHCIKAMDMATASLAAGRDADGHADFYTVMIMHAFNKLRDYVPQERLATWRRRLVTIVPNYIYRFQPDRENLHNWNLVAVSGEWMRYCAAMGGDLHWIKASLARQMEKFTSYGMYRDPGDPLAYDGFARYYIVNLLEQGYAGPYAMIFDELMERGAWTSLFLQSPQGEVPCGGRSAHHQWNEATYAMICEVYARRFARRGDFVAAGAFKRSARLALKSIARWVRPSGELWIIKNRYDPALRYGYESYSFHSQYNLLTAAKLAIAYLYADDAVGEQPCPSEVGGFAFALQPAFHKVFANAGGMYLEIDTRADAQYNPTGLLRVHHPQVEPQVSVSDGVSANRIYETPRRPTLSLSISPAWRDSEGSWHTLAEHNDGVLCDADVQIKHESPDGVEFEVVYHGVLRGNATRARQVYRVSPSRIDVTDIVEGFNDRFRQYFPLFVTDGEQPTKIEVSGRHAAVMHADGSAQTYEISDEGKALVRLGIVEPFRNGAFDAAYVESSARTMRYSIQPIPGRRA
jgi:hypothetical protein